MPLVYIKDNLDKNILLAEIASHLGMSEHSLHRLIKSDVKMTFIHYYTLLRMFKALEYLLEKKYTIGEITLMVGNSFAHIQQYFFKILGK